MEYATFLGIKNIMEYNEIRKTLLPWDPVFSIMFRTRYYLHKFVFILDVYNATCDIFGTTSQGQLDI